MFFLESSIVFSTDQWSYANISQSSTVAKKTKAVLINMKNQRFNFVDFVELTINILKSEFFNANDNQFCITALHNNSCLTHREPLKLLYEYTLARWQYAKKNLSCVTSLQAKF